MNTRPTGTSRTHLACLLLLSSLPIAVIHAQFPESAPPPAFPQNNHRDEEKNLLENGNFEHGLEHWELIAFSKKGKMSIDPIERYNGKPTLRIENNEADHSFVRQILKGKPNTRYRLSGYIKTSRVEPEQKGDNGAVLMLGMSLDRTHSQQKTTPWTKVSFDFVPKNPNEMRVGPSLGVYARPVTGTAWFSDLTLTELGPVEKH